MNYLQRNDKGILGSDEQKLADYFGAGHYFSFYKKHLLQNKIKITKDDFIAGEIPVMFNAMKKLGIDYKHDDYPDALKKYLHRRIWETKLGYMQDKAFNDYLMEPVFIKPKDKLKKFTGFVLNSRDDWMLTQGASAGTNIVCSEPVRWITEYRVPVVNNVPLDYCNYFGNPDIMVSRVTVNEMVRDWAKAGAPSAYCLDVGILDTGDTALIDNREADHDWIEMPEIHTAYFAKWSLSNGFELRTIAYNREHKMFEPVKLYETYLQPPMTVELINEQVVKITDALRKEFIRRENKKIVKDLEVLG